MSRLRVLRWLYVAAALAGCGGWGLVALDRFPWIVPADSDLGNGAMGQVNVAIVMGLIAAGAAALGTGRPTAPRLRMAAALALLALVALVPLEEVFEHDRPDHVDGARCAQILLISALVAIEHLEGRLVRGVAVSWRSAAGWLVLAPLVFVATDRVWREYLGRLPSGRWVRPALPNGAWAGASAREHSEAPGVEVSHRNGVRVTGYNDGRLVVENLVGGPAFCFGPLGDDRRLKVLTLSADGTTLAAADVRWQATDSTIRVWDVKPGDVGTPPTLTLKHEFCTPEARACSLALCPDGRTLLAAHQDGTVRAWDLAQGEEKARFVPHPHPRSPDAVYRVAVSRDGALFATGAPGCIRIWERATLRRVRSLRTAGAYVSWLAFTPDGSALVALDDEWMTRWLVRPPWLSAAAAGLATSALVVWVLRCTPSAASGNGAQAPRDGSGNHSHQPGRVAIMRSCRRDGHEG